MPFSLPLLDALAAPLDRLLAQLQVSLIFGTAGSDTIEREGNGLTVLAFGGDDTVTTTTGPGIGGNRILGGAGNDTLAAIGDNNWVSGGLGADHIFFSSESGTGSSGNTAFGGLGADEIYAVGSGNTLHGGLGDDVITITGQRVSGNFAHGEGGDDTLSAFGFDNRLEGGSGDDTLIGSSFGFGTGVTVGAGTIMAGGSGTDHFTLTNSSLLRVEQDTDGVVGAGDSISGVIDEILDYTAGERVSIASGTAHQGAVAVADTGSVPPGTLGPVLAAGEYTTFHGTLTEAGRFAVAEDGPDLLLVYAAAGSSGPTAGSAVAFLGYDGDVLLG